MVDLGIYLNFVCTKEHVPGIERLNWTIKEYVRSARAVKAFKQISKWMIIHLVTTSIFWLNDFTLLKPGAGMPNTKYPGQLVPEIFVDYKKFFASSQENIYRYTKIINPVTSSI